MLVHRWDQALSEAEWRSWLAEGHDFGQLVVSSAAGWPLVVPTHFVSDGGHLLVHLARPNPVWRAIEANPRVTLSVVDDYAYIPATWRPLPDAPPEHGVPTSYYAAVQFHCHAEIVDDPAAKAELLRRQLAHFQPAGGHAEVSAGAGPYARLLPGIRGLRLHVARVVAKFKFDDHKDERHRRAVAERLRERAQGRDAGARRQQLRRLAAGAP